MLKHQKNDAWTVIGIILLLFFIIFFIYPCIRLLWQAFFTVDEKTGIMEFTFKYFIEFFSKHRNFVAIWNSFKVSFWTMLFALIIGISLSYFYSFYNLKGRKILFITALLGTMSAPFIGAYSWIKLLGNNGIIVNLLGSMGIRIGSIYGFKGILLVHTLKFFPLVMIYMNGAFKSIDANLLEASASLGCFGLKHFYNIVIGLTAPTILAAALIVFMRVFADFGTPQLIGRNYTTLPVLIYTSYISETNLNYSYAAAICVITMFITGIIFLIQKFAVSRFKFTVNSMHPLQRKASEGFGGVLMHIYCYFMVFVSLLPQFYIIIDSFREYKGQVQQSAFSLANYENALHKMLGRSVGNTLFISILALMLIVITSTLIAYIVIRRPGPLSNAVDGISMLPYIMPGTVIGISLILGFNNRYFKLTGTFMIIVIALVIRRMPYTSRSATAIMMQIPVTTEEAGIPAEENLAREQEDSSVSDNVITVKPLWVRNDPSVLGNKLVMYSTYDDQQQKIVEDLWYTYYPDCIIEWVSDSVGKNITRVRSEISNPYADVIYGGMFETDGNAYHDVLQLYTPSIADQLTAIDSYGYYTLFDIQYVALVVNTQLEAELGIEIKSYADLLNPKLKGKIIIGNPAISSSAYHQFFNVLAVMGNEFADDKSWEYVDELIRNCDGVITDSSSLVYKDVIAGEYVVGLSYENILKMQIVLNGADNIRLVYPAEGNTSVASGASMVRNCPHYEAAAAMLDMAASAEYQQLRSENSCARGTNSTISYGNYPEDSELNIVTVNYEALGNMRAGLLEKWADHWDGLN